MLIADNSVGLSVFSPPFSNLYIYSDSIADMGNTEDDEEFMEQFRFLIRELLRITIPGRNCSVHCKDLPLYRGRDGAAGLRDFPGHIIRTFEEEGWTFHSRCTIWKDPVIEMQRTKNHGLLYKQLCADSAASRQGMADYIITFRKWNSEAEFPDPVTANGERFDRYVGLEPPDASVSAYDAGVPVPPKVNGMWPNYNPFEKGTEAYRLWSISVWQRYASPVWMDINQTDVLNKDLARDGDDERHICPLQLDVIERCIHLWSNEGDLVFSPFTGIGSEGYVALKCGRRFIGTELKKSYFDIAVKNLKEAAGENNLQVSLFDMEIG
jgi:DNA modification methylase